MLSSQSACEVAFFDYMFLQKKNVVFKQFADVTCFDLFDFQT